MSDAVGAKGAGERDEFDENSLPRAPAPRLNLAQRAVSAWQSFRTSRRRVHAEPRLRGRVGDVDERDLQTIRDGGFSAGMVRYSRAERGVEGESRWPRWVGLGEMQTWAPWRAGMVELVGSLAYTMLQGGMASIGVPVYGPASFAVSTGLVIFLLIISMAPVSGGHFNPLVSLSAFSVGRMGFFRCLVYIFSQTLGSIIAAACILAMAPSSLSASRATGVCTWPSEAVQNPHKMIVAETTFGFLLLFVIHATAMDPQQAAVLGAILAPFFIALAVGILFYAAFHVAPGVAFNAARCAGPAIISAEFDGHWAHWVGNIAAVLLFRLYLLIVPPSYLEKTNTNPIKSEKLEPESKTHTS